MTDRNSEKTLSRVDDNQFVEREAELSSLLSVPKLAAGGRPPARLILGRRHLGKTEILKKAFDRLFATAGHVIPIYYSFPGRSENIAVGKDFVRKSLVQMVAFRLGNRDLARGIDGPIDSITSIADREDLPWVKMLLHALGASPGAIDNPFLLPAAAARHSGLVPLIIFDDVERVAHTVEPPERESNSFVGQLASAVSSAGSDSLCMLCGLERVLLEALPSDEQFLSQVESLTIKPLSDTGIERVIRDRAQQLGIEVSDSTTELMVQQLRGDLFYIRAVLDAAASQRSPLKTFVDFEKIYAFEVLNGRISQYLAGVLRSITASRTEQRALLDVLRLVIEAGGPVPIEDVSARLRECDSDPDVMLSRLNGMELLDVSYGFVSATDDLVVADYIRATHRNSVVGSRAAIAGEELLRDKLKSSYRLMMSRYNRSVETRLIELLSNFDFQNVPAILFDQRAFDSAYRGFTLVQLRRAMEDEEKRIRLPQMVLIKDGGSRSERGVTMRLLIAGGFEGGIYSESNEISWLIALVNSREPLDEDELARIDRYFETALRGRRESESISTATRWYISKEGFTQFLLESRDSTNTYFSSYLQLDLLHEYLTRRPVYAEAAPSTDFELTIPIEDEAELIAARTAEQIARSASFDQQAINQIKTALIEACINAAEHSDSPDRRIHQRFSLNEDRLVITVRNKGKHFGLLDAQPSPTADNSDSGSRVSRGRGLQIIRALMDEVRFERTDDGACLVMTKFLKRPDQS